MTTSSDKDRKGSGVINLGVRGRMGSGGSATTNGLRREDRFESIRFHHF